ncbi:hypothetical protein GGF32_005730 [Allomyces javanicus]|nr:hypothetical protein GGF32_005730 [Allomyces javanicus]
MTISQPALFHQFQHLVHAIDPQLADQMHLASGGLPDLGSAVSDVDVAVVHDDANAVRAVLDVIAPASSEDDEEDDETGVTETHRDAHSVVYLVHGFPRPVNVYISSSEKDAMRAVVHRWIELTLNAQFPTLASMAVALKKWGGVGTEEAWYRVLELDGTFPVTDKDKAPWFAAMLDEKAVMEAARRQDAWARTYLARRLPKAHAAAF